MAAAPVGALSGEGSDSEWRISVTAFSEGARDDIQLGVGALATTLLSPLESLTTLFAHHRSGLERAQPAGAFVNSQPAVFTFFHCAPNRDAAIAALKRLLRQQRAAA